VRKCQPTTDVTKEALALPGFGQQLLRVGRTRKLENEAALKTNPSQFAQNSVPIDIARTWSQMFISLAVIVMCVDHA
jgi:hypothetical protein